MIFIYIQFSTRFLTPCIAVISVLDFLICVAVFRYQIFNVYFFFFLVQDFCYM